MLQDLRFAFRLFARQRGFFLVAVSTLALGVGLTTTIFSVADGVLFRPLPYPDPARLFAVFGAARTVAGAGRVGVAPGDYGAWRATGVFADLSAMSAGSPVALQSGDVSRRARSMYVDEHFFAVLGVVPALGRSFGLADCREGAPPVVMLTYGTWKREFESEPAVIGRTIQVAGRSTEVVGVLPDGFLFPASWSLDSPEVLRPLIVPAATVDSPRPRVYTTIARLAAGATVAGAQARLDAAQQARIPLYPASDRSIPGAFDGVTMVPLDEFLRSQAREGVLYLFLAACGVLLIASMNVASMVLARGSDRERELAIRAAMGASRARLVRLLVVESVLLAMIGGAAGVVLARWSFDAVMSQVPERLMLLKDPRIDLRVVAFAWLAALAVGVLFGAAPALKLSRPDVGSVTKNGAGGTWRAGWGRDLLMVVQVSLAVALVGTGTLVLKSFAGILGIDPGMDVERVLTMQLALPERLVRDAASRTAFYENALAAVRGVPGVEGAALTNGLTLAAGGSNFATLSLDGVASQRLYTRGNRMTEVSVTPDYFRVMGIPILRGGAFPEAAGTAPDVAVVTQRLGRYAGVDPLGRELISLQGAARRYRIIGVARDARDARWDAEPMSVMYLPFKSDIRPIVVVRAGRPLAVASQVRKAILGVDREVVPDQIRTLDDLMMRSVAERRFNAFLYGTFSMSALGLSMIGIYGLIAYTVSRRQREIGIRVALGATKRSVLSLILVRLTAVLALGTLGGLIGLLAMQKTIGTMLYQLQPTEPAALLTTVGLMVLAGGFGAYLPARRASRIDPMIALRAE